MGVIRNGCRATYRSDIVKKFDGTGTCIRDFDVVRSILPGALEMKPIREHLVECVCRSYETPLILNEEESGVGQDVLQNNADWSYLVQSGSEESEEQNDDEEESSDGTIEVVRKVVGRLICAKEEAVPHMECLAEKWEYFGGISARSTPHCFVYTCRNRYYCLRYRRKGVRCVVSLQYTKGRDDGLCDVVTDGEHNDGKLEVTNWSLWYHSVSNAASGFHSAH